MKFVDPKVDIAFKKIFGDERRKHVLISFLNAVMNQDIAEVEILNPYQVPKIPELKFTILDIKAKDRNGREFIVEMQANPYKYFDKRALHYVANAYVKQLKGGEDYKHLQPVYFIGVLNFDFFNSEHYLSCHLIQNIETQEQEIRDFAFYFLELKKFFKNADELSTVLDKWTYFLKKIDEESDIPAALAIEPEIREAANTANQATWTAEELAAYEHGLREEQKELDMIEELEQKRQELSEKDKTISEKDKEIQDHQIAITQKDEALRKSIHLLLNLKQSLPDIANSLDIPLSEVERLAN